jgi:outer membrane biosynthesis protein TonB
MSTNPYYDDKRLLELLERWQSGDFTRADEQELQSLADSDEFRREAVEGFWSLPEADHSQHLAALRERLRNQSGHGRRAFLPQFYMAAAAVFLLVLAVVWLFPSQDKMAPMAEKEAAPAAPPAEQPIASNLPELKSSEPEASRGYASPALDKMSRSVAADNQPTGLFESGPAASDAATEVASAPPAPVQNQEGAVMDEVIVSMPPARQSDTEMTQDASEEVDMIQGNSAPRAKSRKEYADASKAMDPMKKKASALASESAPADGWDHFQDYLRKNARLTEAARQNNITGKVRVRFQLDSSNQPGNFQIIQSLGYGCDEEAIRLIKAYSWQRGKNPEATVDVPFIR